jgi:hypothetical protein
MSISFRNDDGNSTTEIFINKNFIGTVVLDVWTSKWKLKPEFNYNSYVSHEALNIKYDSSYKAGKALAKFYEDTYKSHDEVLEDTQEIDMKALWESFEHDP